VGWRLEKREQQSLTTTTAQPRQPIAFEVTGEPGVQEVRVRADSDPGGPLIRAVVAGPRLA